MSRPPPIIPVDAKMYRHFAIATVMITGCLAVFASGENREALADTIESQQRQVEVQQAQAQAKKPAAKKSNFTDKRKVKGSFGSDADLRWDPPPMARRGSGYAQTMEAERVAASPASFGGGGTGPSGPVTVTGALPPGMSPAEYDLMMNQKKKKKAPPPSRQMTEQEVEAMFAASDARSLTRQD
jgi:hypothetical protein